MSDSTNTASSFSLELVAMVAVIAISSWHVGSYMNTFDGWIMAAIMGATLGFCNFLMAHNIFKPNSTSRFPSFCGLIFFACTSTYMQYTYFNADADIGTTLVMGINLDALALGVWAPAAEILLGWIYAAGLKQSLPQRSKQPAPSKFERLVEAFTNQIEQRLNDPRDGQVRSIEHTETVSAIASQQAESTSDSAPSSRNSLIERAKLNGQYGDIAVQQNGKLEHDDVQLNGNSGELNTDQAVQIERAKLSKPEAIERLLAIYRSNPQASYEEIARAIGRSKGTVANYVKELKQRQQIHVTEDTVEVLG